MNYPKSDYKVAVAQAEADYKVAKARCDSLGGHPREVCVEEARAREKRAKAEAEARYKGTPKAREQARIAAVDGDYEVAKARCGIHVGDARKACEAEAKAVRARAVANIMAGAK